MLWLSGGVLVQGLRLTLTTEKKKKRMIVGALITSVPMLSCVSLNMETMRF